MTQQLVIVEVLKAARRAGLGAAQLRVLLWWLAQHGYERARIPKLAVVEVEAGVEYGSINRTLKSLRALGLVELHGHGQAKFMRYIGT